MIAQSLRTLAPPVAAVAAASSVANFSAERNKPHQARRVSTTQCQFKPSDYPPPAVSVYSEFGYKGVDLAGIPYPPTMRPTVVADLQGNNFLRSGQAADIVIATYPKCGTTWMQQIILLLLADGDVSKVRDPMKMSPWVERECCRNIGLDEWAAWSPAKELQAAEPTRRVIKTHAPIQLAPWAGGVDGIPDDAKVVVVVRNPKDAAISLYNHTKDVPVFEYTGTWEHFAPQLFLQGFVESGCFWKWYAGWWHARQHSSAGNIYWISYEEMKMDLRGSVKRIADFIGVEASEALLDRVVAGSSFAAMKQAAAEEDAKKAARGEFVKKDHIRQGLSGSWRKVFSSDLNTAFDVHHRDMSKQLGLPEKVFDFA